MEYLYQRKLWVLCGLVAFFAVALAGCGGGTSTQTDATTTEPAPVETEAATGSADTGTSGTAPATKLKVAVLYNSTISDGYELGWHDGIAAAIEGIGADRIELTEVKSVPYDQQATQITEQLFEGGQDVVVDTTGFGTLFFDACKKYPDKRCISYYPVPVDAIPANTSGFYVKAWNGLYLEGVAAGLLTESNTIGWVGSFESGFDNAGLNSWVLGCQSVNPDCNAIVIYTNSFKDPPKATEAAQTLINSGADVIAAYQDDPSALRVAEKAGVWGFGLYEADQGALAPNAFVTATVLMETITSRGMTDQLQAILDGQPMAGLTLYSISEGGGLAPWGAKVPPDVQTQVEAVASDIDGGTNVFVGPISDNKDKVRVPEGDSLDDAFIYDQWDWLVAGIKK